MTFDIEAIDDGRRECEICGHAGIKTVACYRFWQDEKRAWLLVCNACLA